VALFLYKYWINPSKLYI